MFVGLTGGIACGKSVVAKIFQELGAHLIDADALAHTLLEPGQPGYKAAIAAFGPSILHPAPPPAEPGGRPEPINRAELGARVFADPAQRARLESILHPMIFAEARRRRAALETDDPNALILFEAPLLFETGADGWVDQTIVVTADDATQLSRLMTRDGLSRDEALNRLKAQLPVAEKQRRADFCIDGTRPLDDIHRQVAAIYEKLKGR